MSRPGRVPRRGLSSLLVAALVASSLAACGGSSSDSMSSGSSTTVRNTESKTTTQTQGTTQTQTQTPTATQTQPSGGVTMPHESGAESSGGAGPQSGTPQSNYQQYCGGHGACTD